MGGTNIDMIRIIKITKKKEKGQMCHSRTQGDERKVDVGVVAKWTLMSNCGKREVFLQSYFKKNKCLETSATDIILKSLEINCRHHSS